MFSSFKGMVVYVSIGEGLKPVSMSIVVFPYLFKEIYFGLFCCDASLQRAENFSLCRYGLCCVIGVGWHRKK
jgi:hypothetical protein